MARINRLITEAFRTPSEGTGKPERLRSDLAGYWSRRIDHEHRLVYRADGDKITVIQCKYHYRGRTLSGLLDAGMVEPPMTRQQPTPDVGPAAEPHQGWPSQTVRGVRTAG